LCCALPQFFSMELGGGGPRKEAEAGSASGGGGGAAATGVSPGGAAADGEPVDPSLAYTGNLEVDLVSLRRKITKERKLNRCTDRRLLLLLCDVMWCAVLCCFVC
jgi:hypothetical protein